MFRLALLLAIVAQARPALPPPTKVPLRFHHLHYRVSDVTGTLVTLRPRADEAPVILSGLGAGARFGRAFILFDRAAPDEPGEIWLRGSIPSRYAEVTRWLASRGLPVEPADRDPASLAALVTDPANNVTHVAFATANLPAAVIEIERAGVPVTRRNENSVTFRVPVSGSMVELVRDSDLPDQFYCPMHPDVRSPVEGACPICRMTLVAIPPLRIGMYKMTVSPLAVSPSGGLTGLRIEILEPGEGARRVTAFTNVHDKRLHLFLVGRDLTYFAHVHPDQRSDGTFDLRQTIPAGEYLVVADFLPLAGTPQTLQKVWLTPGASLARLKSVVAEPPVALTAQAGGIRATLAPVTLAPGRAASLQFSLVDATTGKPLTDLEPYLSAPAHLMCVSADLAFAEHGHPASQQLGEATVSVELALPTAGAYKIWLQVQRKGRIITLPFVVRVTE